MKNYIILFCSILLLSCQSKKPDSVQTEATERQQAVPWSIASEIISMDEAAGYIAELLSDPNRQHVFGNVMGGTFNKDDFFNGTTLEEGVMMWYNFNAHSADYPPVFMSIEKMNYQTATQTGVSAQQATLNTPVEYFSYNSTCITKRCVLDYLKTGFTNTTKTNKDTIHKDVVDSLATQFAQRQASPTGPIYNQSNHAYFQNANILSKPVLNELLSQPGVTQVRYFFGMDAANHPNNKIRIILIGTQRNGKHAAVVIQKSIPDFAGN